MGFGKLRLASLLSTGFGRCGEVLDRTSYLKKTVHGTAGLAQKCHRLPLVFKPAEPQE